MLNFKRMPSWKILLILIIFSGLTEGIGMSALIPIMATISNETNLINNNFPFNILPDAFSYFGIETSFPTLLGGCVVLIILTFSIIYFQERLLYNSKYKFLLLIREEALKKLFASTWSHLSKKVSGELSNILIKETERGADALTSLLMMIAIGFQLLCYTLFTFILSWEMTLISLFTITITGIVAVYLIRKVRVYGTKSVEVDTNYNSLMVETVRGSKLLRATAISDSFLNIVNKSGFSVSETHKKISISQATLRFTLQVMVLISMAIILLIGVKVLMISVNTLFVFMFILLRLAPKTFTFYSQYHNYTAFKPALNIVDKLLEDAEIAYEALDKTSKENIKFENEISFKNVFYRYNTEDKFSLRNINITIPSKKIIGIAGKSGSGKTTFIDLFLGLLKPDKGSIMIDGMNINSINKNQYRNIVSYVPQDNIFFNGTIKDNITLGLKNVSNKEILECLKISQIDNFVSSFQNGINTLMSEAGANMSGGQRQRLAITRALLRKPKLLILDEATSSLDNQIEAKFRSALEKSNYYSTVIVVAHRLSNLKNADTILVFDEGEIVQEGTFNSLSSRKGVFKELLKLDKKNVN